MLDLLETLASTWLTQISLGAGFAFTAVKCFAEKDWSKQTMFFAATNFASALVLFTILICIWVKPSMTGVIVTNNSIIVTWGIIYALHDNVSDLFKRTRK